MLLTYIALALLGSPIRLVPNTSPGTLWTNFWKCEAFSGREHLWRLRFSFECVGAHGHLKEPADGAGAVVQW